MEMADMITGAFEQFTQGVGSAVEAWVLYGEAGPNAMRKMTAQVLASLAAQAAAKALFYTAEGIVALFLDPPLAGAFFTAAAIMGLSQAVRLSQGERSRAIVSRIKARPGADPAAPAMAQMAGMLTRSLILEPPTVLTYRLAIHTIWPSRGRSRSLRRRSIR
jgi:hypothetical protein